MNGPVFVAAVIEREDWRAEISFVGHANTIQVAVRLTLLFENLAHLPVRLLIHVFSFGRVTSLLALLPHAC